MKKIATFLILSLVSISCKFNDIGEITGFVVDKEFIKERTTPFYFDDLGSLPLNAHHPARYYLYIADKKGTIKIIVSEEDYREYNMGAYVKVKYKIKHL
jgi:lipoprotein